jgi:RimJ/RimL family protein N-acetyltransferase
MNTALAPIAVHTTPDLRCIVPTLPGGVVGMTMRRRRRTVTAMSDRTSPDVPELRTERLVLRAWRDEDRAPFAALNADPAVMEHFPATLSRVQSDEFVDRMVERWRSGEPSLWAVEVPGAAPFIGYVGLLAPGFDAPFTPCVEVGWRLAAEHWGHGYAPEGAVAALGFGFDRVGLDEIVSFTVEANERSRRVMAKLGMHHDPTDDFDHPNLPAGHPMQRHVLYRISAREWSAGRGRVVGSA